MVADAILADAAMLLLPFAIAMPPPLCYAMPYAAFRAFHTLTLRAYAMLLLRCYIFTRRLFICRYYATLSLFMPRLRHAMPFPLMLMPCRRASADYALMLPMMMPPCHADAIFAIMMLLRCRFHALFRRADAADYASAIIFRYAHAMLITPDAASSDAILRHAVAHAIFAMFSLTLLPFYAYAAAAAFTLLFATLAHIIMPLRRCCATFDADITISLAASFRYFSIATRAYAGV